MITLGMTAKKSLRNEVLAEEDVNPDDYRSKSEAKDNDEYWWDRRYHKYKSELARRNNLKSRALEILIDMILDANENIDSAVSEDIPEKFEGIKFTKQLSVTRCQYESLALKLYEHFSDGFEEGTSPDIQIKRALEIFNLSSDKNGKTFADTVCKHNISRSEIVPLKGFQTRLKENPYQYYIIYRRESSASDSELYVTDSVRSCLDVLCNDLDCLRKEKCRIRRDYLYRNKETGKYYFFEAKNMESSGLTASVIHDAVKYAYAIHDVVDDYDLEIIYNGDIDDAAVDAIKSYRDTDFQHTDEGLNIRDPKKIDVLVRRFGLDVGGLLYDGDHWFKISRDVARTKYGYGELVVDLRYDTDYSVVNFEENYRDLVTYLQENTVADVEEINKNVFDDWSQDKTMSFVDSLSSVQRLENDNGLDDYLLKSSVKETLTEEDLSRFLSDYLPTSVKNQAKPVEEVLR